MKKLILKTSLSPGDVVMLTAAVRDLHQAHRHHYLTDVRTPSPALWEHNPYLTPLREEDPDVEVIECHYPLIDRCNTTPYHCLHGYTEFLNERLGLSIRPTLFKGDIHLAPVEKSWHSQIRELAGQELPFWIIAAGGKFDYTIKWWDERRFQAVIDHFAGRIQFVQVGAMGDYHPWLQRTIDLRGRTDLRELVRLVYHAQGVLCPVTCLMHLAAAVETKEGAPPNRPCVVIGGGREPWHWEAYPHHQYLHTNGALSCCAQGGCWKSRTLPLGDGTEFDHPDQLCANVAEGLPRCMDLISAGDVIRAIERYFDGGVIDYLSTAQARRGTRGASKTRDNDFDKLLNLHTAVPAAASFLAQIPPPPDGLAGRGIVLCGGGPRFFPGIWVCLNMLRRLGCLLPVQIWHLGPQEVDSQMRSLTKPLNAEWIDAHKVRRSHPARLLGGWELKSYAILHSPFREVLLLDADNVPVLNPESLFEDPHFVRAGAVLWPDLNVLRREDRIWRVFGVSPREEREVESGQILVDKKKCWKALALCGWYNDHSDFYYRFSSGDKETFPMAFRTVGQPFAMPDKSPRCIETGLCQFDFHGRRMFQHRCWDKWNLFRNQKRDPLFQYEQECLDYLRPLRSLWQRRFEHERLTHRPRPDKPRADEPPRRNALERNFTIVTLHDSGFAQLAKVTAESMRAYAGLHDYRFVHHSSPLDRSRHPAWNKILAVRNALRENRSKWALWIDADAVVMNPEVRAEDLVVEGADLVFGSDFNGLNSSVFLVRNCAWSLGFLDTVYRLGDINYDLDRYGDKWEQNTIKHVLSNFSGFIDHVRLLPENRMNASPAVFRPGDFILHLGGMPMEERFRVLDRYGLSPNLSERRGEPAGSVESGDEAIKQTRPVLTNASVLWPKASP